MPHATGEPLRLFNTLGRELQVFEPLEAEAARVYSCGPTVYAYQHIGNLRAYVFADTLRRVLEWKGYEVVHVVNITDVGHLTSDMDAGEDKVEAASRRERRSVWDVVAHYTDAFLRDLAELRVRAPTTWARATEHIEQMIGFARALEENGYAYRLETGLYFDTAKAQDYGKLARLDLEGQREGARISPATGKRNPADFALWRTSPRGSRGARSSSPGTDSRRRASATAASSNASASASRSGTFGASAIRQPDSSATAHLGTSRGSTRRSRTTSTPRRQSPSWSSSHATGS